MVSAVARAAAAGAAGRGRGGGGRDKRTQIGHTRSRRLTVHRWLFEVEGGHGQIHQRIEDTHPSSVDPVNNLDTTHGSQRVTQKKRLSDDDCKSG